MGELLPKVVDRELEPGYPGVPMPFGFGVAAALPLSTASNLGSMLIIVRMLSRGKYRASHAPQCGIPERCLVRCFSVVSILGDEDASGRIVAVVAPSLPSALLGASAPHLDARRLYADDPR